MNCVYFSIYQLCANLFCDFFYLLNLCLFKFPFQLRSLNFRKIVGSGILHTKLWIADKQDFYIGSANMDWRSLTQVKELGIYVQNCTCLASDVAKVFDVSLYLYFCNLR